jgi:hypothetical protein
MMATTQNTEWLTLAKRFEDAAKAVADAIREDDGNGLCISDLQEALYYFRPVMFDVEVLSGDKHPFDE